MEQKIKIELPIILPCVANGEDHCVGRLLELLENQRGVEKVHIDRQQNASFLCVHYYPDYFTPERIQKVIELAGAKVKNRYRHDILRVERMDCRTCADVIEHALARMDGILSVSVNYEAERIRVDYDLSKVSDRQIEERLRILGYTLFRGAVRKPWYRRHRELVFSIICGLLLLGGTILVFFPHQNATLPLVLFIMSFFTGGYFAFKDTLKTLLKGKLDIEFLMLLAAVGAAILGKWQEGALLLFLFSLGHALEHLAMDKARESINALGKITPKSALVLRNGEEKEVPVEELLRGDVVIVKAGERIPADGKVAEGHSLVDQSPITGESIPVEKNPGDQLFAGTVNGNGVIKLSVTRLSQESTIARVLSLIEEAQAQKSSSQRFSESFERIFVPVVFLVVILMLIVPLLLGQNPMESLYRALAILVAASPCALAIATPSAVLAGIARAASDGVLIKGGVHLENLGKLHSIAFDKTGTITGGSPGISSIMPCPPFTEDEVLQIAASVECKSDHPLARAIILEAEKRSIKLFCADNIESLSGKGILSRTGDDHIVIGKRSFFTEEEIPQELKEAMAGVEASGSTAIFVVRNRQCVGMIALLDRPRENAREAVERIKSLNISPVIMITGDNRAAAEGVAASVGIDEVSADLLPEEKVAAIAGYVKKYGYIAMVGDGINDAPAMAHSTVGIAMGSAGTDIALETADVALMADNLLKLPFVIALGRKVSTVIRQNLFIALGMIAILVIAVLMGWAGISIAVIAHEGSTLLVVANALGILGFRDRSSQARRG